MQYQTLPAMKEYTATPLSTSREGAARPAATNKSGPGRGPPEEFCTHFSGTQAPEQGKHVPEVGLELHSLPREHWHPRKHAESGPNRPTYDPVRCPKCGNCTHPKIGQVHASPNNSPRSPSRAQQGRVSDRVPSCMDFRPDGSCPSGQILSDPDHLRAGRGPPELVETATASTSSEEGSPDPLPARPRPTGSPRHVRGRFPGEWSGRRPLPGRRPCPGVGPAIPAAWARRHPG